MPLPHGLADAVLSVIAGERGDSKGVGTSLLSSIVPVNSVGKTLRILSLRVVHLFSLGDLD